MVVEVSFLSAPILQGCSDPPQHFEESPISADECALAFAPGLSDVTPLDSTTMVAVGAQGTFLRSEDGGRAWTLAASPCDEFPIRSITRMNDNEAWAVGGLSTSGTIPWAILRSVDAGRTWRVQEVTNSSPQDSFVQILSPSRDTLVVLGRSPRISRDRGASWSTVDAPTPILRAVSSGPHELIGFNEGHHDLWILDCGSSSWRPAPVALPDSYSIADLAFSGSRHGWIIAKTSSGPGVLNTDDGGKTWTTITPKGLDSGSIPWAVAFCDPMLGYMATSLTSDRGANRLHVTRDGGRTWNRVWSGTAETRLYALKASPRGGVVAVGEKGNQAFIVRLSSGLLR